MGAPQAQTSEAPAPCVRRSVRRRTQGAGISLSFACGGSLVLASPAHAYLDPGAGSMLAQLAAAGFAGLAVLLRLYWGRIKARLKGGPADKKP